MVETLARLPLGEAAMAVRKHPSTLTKAANNKDPEKRLPFTLGDDGDRLFSIPELKKRFGKVYSPEDNSPVKTMVRTSGNLDNSPSDSLVHIEKIHQVRTSALEEKVSVLRDMNEQLKTQLERSDMQTETFRKVLESQTFQLTDQREESAKLKTKLEAVEAEKEAILLSDNSVLEAGQGGNFWRNIAAAFVVVALVGTALYYRDNIVETLAKFTAADDSAAAAEVSLNEAAPRFQYEMSLNRHWPPQ